MISFHLDKPLRSALGTKRAFLSSIYAHKSWLRRAFHHPILSIIPYVFAIAQTRRNMESKADLDTGPHQYYVSGTLMLYLNCAFCNLTPRTQDEVTNLPLHPMNPSIFELIHLHPIHFYSFKFHNSFGIMGSE